MIGLVTIGQAPRNDITASMFDEQSIGQTLQFGALDGLNRREIHGLRPGADGSVLVSRLIGGTEVELEKSRLTPLVQVAINRALDAGVSVVCVLCTGAFVGLEANVPIIFPDQILRGVVDSLLPKGRLGVLMPHEDQRPGMISRWSCEQREVVASAVSPYTAASNLAAETRRLSDDGVDLILMDCMGFTRAMERSVRAAADNIPVILSNGIVGAVIVETWGLMSAGDDAVIVQPLY